MNRTALFAAAILILVLAGGWYALSRKVTAPGAMTPETLAAPVEVRVPKLSADARAGEKLFNANCAACHGKNAGGTENGPPFVHRYYRPDHHADYAFVMAVRGGVRAHHWRFGDMPPVEGVSDSDVTLITRYVRALQKANGVF